MSDEVSIPEGLKEKPTEYKYIFEEPIISKRKVKVSVRSKRYWDTLEYILGGNYVS